MRIGIPSSKPPTLNCFAYCGLREVLSPSLANGSLWQVQTPRGLSSPFLPMEREGKTRDKPNWLSVPETDVTSVWSKPQNWCLICCWLCVWFWTNNWPPSLRDNPTKCFFLVQKERNWKKKKKSYHFPHSCRCPTRLTCWSTFSAFLIDS